MSWASIPIHQNGKNIIYHLSLGDLNFLLASASLPEASPQDFFQTDKHFWLLSYQCAATNIYALLYLANIAGRQTEYRQILEESSSDIF
jgi:hypothetical protein